MDPAETFFWPAPYLKKSKLEDQEEDGNEEEDENVEDLHTVYNSTLFNHHYFYLIIYNTCAVYKGYMRSDF